MYTHHTARRVLALLLLLICLPFAQAAAKSASDSLWNSDALKTFMDSWYGYYNGKGVRFDCRSYNFFASKEAEYAQIKDGVRHSILQAYTGTTPVYISVQYFLSSSDEYLFQITDKHLTEIPQNLTILFEGKSLEPFSVECNEYGVHTFRFRQNDIFSIINAIANGGAMTLSYDTDQGTVNVEVSRKSTPLFAEMLELSYHCYQYCNEKSDRYLDKYLLQGHVKPTPTPEAAKYYSPEQKKIMSTLTGIPEYMLGHIFKKGDSNSTIFNIKLKMQELGYYRVDASLSNDFNDIMIERVKQFQKKNGLRETGVINEDVLIKMYAKDAKIGPYYGQTSQSNSNSSSGSSSSKSSSKKSGGHWEWQWKTVWVYQNCYCGHDRHCALCWGSGTYQSPQKQKQKVWVSD